MEILHMKVKRITIGLILVLLLCTLPLFGCKSGKSASGSKDTTLISAASDLKSFTAEELSVYNGKDGNPAYIAVDGKVYDVTDVSQWKDGIHAGEYEAGKDVTDILKTKAPHSASKMDGVPVIGVYTG